MKALYQNLPGAHVQNPKRAKSNFWNEGKWNNFIAPLLPEVVTDQTFVEMGTNAGLFLKMAQDHGYRQIIGIEKDRTHVSEGLKYRDSIGYQYQLYRRTLGGNFNIDDLPVADVTLMSTFHYYIDVNTWVKYLDRLRGKSRSVLIVSRKAPRNHWVAYSDYKDVKRYFDGWTEVGYVPPISVHDDPHPRPDIWSVLFENPLISRLPVDDIIIQEDDMQLLQYELADMIAQDKVGEVRDLSFYQRWMERKAGKWTEAQVVEFILEKIQVMQSVMNDGLREPLLIQANNRLSDGGHRLAMLRALGHKSALVRWI